MVSKTRRAEVLTLWSGEMRQLVTGPYFKMVSKVRVAHRATQVIDVCGSMGAARTKRMSQEGKERRKTSNWVTSWSREKLVRLLHLCLISNIRLLTFLKCEDFLGDLLRLMR